MTSNRGFLGANYRPLYYHQVIIIEVAGNSDLGPGPFTDSIIVVTDEDGEFLFVCFKFAIECCLFAYA